jgi:hypothetical protein
LGLRNQETAATLGDIDYGGTNLMSSSNLPRKLKNIDREYEISDRNLRKISLTKQFSTEYHGSYGMYSPRGGQRDRPSSEAQNQSALKNAGKNLVFHDNRESRFQTKHQDDQESYTNPLFGYSEGDV